MILWLFVEYARSETVLGELWDSRSDFAYPVVHQRFYHPSPQQIHPPLVHRSSASSTEQIIPNKLATQIDHEAHTQYILFLLTSSYFVKVNVANRG